MVQTKPVKKVLYIGHFILPDHNAAACRAVANARVLEKLGCFVTVCGKGEDCVITDSIVCKNTGYSHTDITRYYALLDEADVIIGYNLHSRLTAKLLHYCSKNKKRFYVDCTEWQSYKNPLKAIDAAITLRILNKRADGIIAVSSYLQNYYSAHLPVIKMPPLTDITPGSKGKGGVRLCFAGTISKQKEALDEAVVKLCQTDIDFTLDILGCTKQEFFNTYKLDINDSRVRFYGKLSHKDTIEHIKNCDYSLCIRRPSRKTAAGFATKFAQSISCGVPVIATDTGDAAEYIKDGKNGFIIDLDTVDFKKVFASKPPIVETTLFDYNSFVDTAYDFFIKKRILISRKKGGNCGGPYVSHTRILNSDLKNNFELIPLEIQRARDLLKPLGLRRLAKSIKAQNPDIVLITGLALEGYLSALACKKAKAKTLLAVRGSSLEALDKGKLFKAVLSVLEKRTVSLCENVFSVSDYAATFEPLKNARNNFGTVYNLTPAINEHCKNTTCDSLCVLSAGRITKDKGFDILLSVIKKSSPDIRFIIAGDGNYLGTMQQEIINADLQDRVIFTGFCQVMSSLYKDADIFMLCTKHETLCNAAIEAQCNSIPVISTNVGGLPEAVKDGFTGILVKDCSADAFLSALSALENDRQLLATMSQNCIPYINDKFDNTKTLTKLGEIFNTIIGDN